MIILIIQLYRFNNIPLLNQKEFKYQVSFNLGILTTYIDVNYQFKYSMVQITVMIIIVRDKKYLSTHILYF